jgi:predicted transglutaminase-like cysteine proteinase
MSDMAQFGEADVWSAPLKTLASGRGDCEDYAILKYAALLAVGMPADDLRLLVVRENRSKRAHAVLAARHEGDWLSLDNKRFTLVSLRDAAEYDVMAALALESARPIDIPRVPHGSDAGVRYARLAFEHFALRPGLYVVGDTDATP